MPKSYGERIEKLKEQREKSNDGSTRSNKKPQIKNGNATRAEKSSSAALFSPKCK